MKKRIVAAGLLSTALCGAAQAQEPGTFYAGTGAGMYYVDFDDLDFDENAATLRAFGGFRLNEYVAFEAGFTKLFESSAYGVDVDGTAWDLSVRPTLPLSDNFEAFAILGWTEYELEASAGGFSDSDSDNDLIYGLGGAFKFNDDITLRGEWTAVDVDQADFGIFSISASYTFR